MALVKNKVHGRTGAQHRPDRSALGHQLNLSVGIVRQKEPNGLLKYCAQMADKLCCGWQIGAIQGTKVGKLHELWMLWNGKARFYLQQPTYRPPHVHVYGRNNQECHAYFFYVEGVWQLKFNTGFSDADIAKMLTYLGYPNRTAIILERVEEILASQEGRPLIEK